MKIAFDVDVLAKQMDINRMVHQVADWGYKYIEQSPHQESTHFINILYFQRNVRRNTKRHSGKPEWRFPPLSLSIAGQDRQKNKEKWQ